MTPDESIQAAVCYCAYASVQIRFLPAFDEILIKNKKFVCAPISTSDNFRESTSRFEASKSLNHIRNHDHLFRRLIQTLMIHMNSGLLQYFSG
ncbi:MAG TPA: hypothetical protein DCM07_21475 [Planctomycetaceae bacterium]|nr:hypothetical protein [Gimesia sp.]HAH47381.1 hypothetical protein [Planctomycetaceae bacterium]HBL44328.1 hypothetical protein [Planctomycetaceae bacterium]